MKDVLKYSGAGVLIALGLLLSWGLIEPRFLSVEYENLAIDDLPTAWDGQRIAQLSDWQIGMWLDNPNTVEEAVATIISDRPAMVLLTGDFVYHADDGDGPDDELRRVAQLIRPLIDAGIPTYAVLGNHDYSMEHESSEPNVELARKVAGTLRRAGVIVLTNEAIPLRAPEVPTVAVEGGPLYLVGIGSHWADNDDVKEALGEVPDGAARVAMMHHPDSFERFPAYTAPLAVAGHTHGGQIRLPGLPTFSYQTFTKTDEVHVDGWIEGFGKRGNHLYVNRGIGMSLVPIRINCAPAVTFFTLQRAEPASEPLARD